MAHHCQAKLLNFTNGDENEQNIIEHAGTRNIWNDIPNKCSLPVEISLHSDDQIKAKRLFIQFKLQK